MSVCVRESVRVFEAYLYVRVVVVVLFGVDNDDLSLLLSMVA
jgi:hypothetical protein